VNEFDDQVALLPRHGEFTIKLSQRLMDERHTVFEADGFHCFRTKLGGKQLLSRWLNAISKERYFDKKHSYGSTS